MNLGRAAISNWETGRTRPDIANIPRLCNVLGITVAAFFSDTPEEAGWNDAERTLMRNYRKLSALNQELLSATAQTMVALERAVSRAAEAFRRAEAAARTRALRAAGTAICG